MASMSLCLQFHIWHLHNNCADLMRHEDQHQSVGTPEKMQPGAAAGVHSVASPQNPAVFGFKALSTFVCHSSSPFHHCLKVRGRGQKLRVTAWGSNEYKHELMFRNLRLTVFSFVLFNLSCISPLCKLVGLQCKFNFRLFQENAQKRRTYLCYIQDSPATVRGLFLLCNNSCTFPSQSLSVQTTWVVLELKFLGINILKLRNGVKEWGHLTLNVHELIGLDYWAFTVIGFLVSSEEVDQLVSV